MLGKDLYQEEGRDMLLTDRRIVGLDYARAVAILLVLLVHATENLFVMDAVHLNAMSVQSRIFAIICFTLGRLGVPLFLFLSGYLLLDRSYTESSIHKFWKKNWLGMLVTTEV